MREISAYLSELYYQVLSKPTKPFAKLVGHVVTLVTTCHRIVSISVQIKYSLRLHLITSNYQTGYQINTAGKISLNIGFGFAFNFRSDLDQHI